MNYPMNKIEPGTPYGEIFEELRKTKDVDLIIDVLEDLQEKIELLAGQHNAVVRDLDRRKT